MQPALAKSSNTPFNLDNYIVNVLRDEPFFAALSRKLEKRASKAIPTAGVMLNKEKGRFELLYNPDFFAKIAARDEKFIKGILLHEFWHIVLLHVTSRLPVGQDELSVGISRPTWRLTPNCQSGVQTPILRQVGNWLIRFCPKKPCFRPLACLRSLNLTFRARSI